MQTQYNTETYYRRGNLSAAFQAVIDPLENKVGVHE